MRSASNAELMAGSLPGTIKHKHGQKKHFTLAQVQRLDAKLRQRGQYRDLALLWFGIDSFLRVSDLRMFRVQDVQSLGGEILSEIRIEQEKTEEPVTIVLSESTRHALQDWIIESGKTSLDFLFTRTARSPKPLSDSAIRRMVKRWAVQLGLPPENYAGHSLRRTKAAYLYSQGTRIEYLRILLGHTDIKNTILYLGIEEQQALSIARNCDMRLEPSDPENPDKHLTKPRKGVDNEDI